MVHVWNTFCYAGASFSWIIVLRSYMAQPEEITLDIFFCLERPPQYLEAATSWRAVAAEH